MTIPITRPWIGEEECLAVAEVLRSGWVSQGPRVQEFERQFCSYAGSRYSFAVTSCTTGLHMALIATGIGPGDEVIVPAFTFVATANAVEYVGARPVFVDVDPLTFNLDVGRLEGCITERTRALIPVHLFGLCADMDPITDIARRHGLGIIEDAACAVGSRYRGQHAGTMGDAGAFSFHPRKPLTTGEGGMLTTQREDLAGQFELLRSHGASMSDLERHRKGGFAMPNHDLVGYNYRMTDMQAALGIVQLGKADDIFARRRAWAERYDAKLRGVPGLCLPCVPEGYVHSYQAYVVRVTGECPVSRDELALELQHRGVSVRVGTHAVHALGYYKKKYGFRSDSYPRAWQSESESLALPLFPQMTEEDHARVVDEILRIIRERLPAQMRVAAGVAC